MAARGALVGTLRGPIIGKLTCPQWVCPANTNPSTLGSKALEGHV